MAQRLRCSGKCVAQLILIDVKQVRGDHLNLVTTEFRLLAWALTGLLRQVARLNSGRKSPRQPGPVVSKAEPNYPAAASSFSTG